jgi:transcriptional regulator with XRE-family HTH domain
VPTKTKGMIMKNLKLLRQDLGLSQYELAGASEVPRWKIQLVEQQIGKFSQEDLEKIEKILLPAKQKKHAQVSK